MAIRKPSDYFNNENNSIEETIQDNAKNSELNTFSDAYNAFKRNLSKVDVLNNFSETLGNYQDNVEKVNYLSEKIDEIDKDIKNLLTKEDLDKALISQLLFLEECIRDVQEKVKGINHKNLTQVKLDISSLSETVNIFIDEEIPRYKKLVFESETRLTDKCEVLEDELKDTLDNIKVFIDEKYVEDFKSLNEEIDKIKTNDIPKYKNLIVDSEIKTDSKIKEFAEVFDNTVNDIVSKIELVKEDNTEIFDTLNSKVNEVNQIHNLMLNDIEKSENTRDELDKKIVDLEVEILRNESHIESQNKNIEDIHGDVKSAIDRLNIGKIEENNFKLGEKIKYLEEVFEKFNEKELLNENIIAEPSSTDNDDPLTPLDKNFVTLDQLQNHYRLFINRIQQQLASFGGGGEVRLEFLDDVDRDSAKVNGKFLKYDSASGKWVGANASGGAGSQTLDETLELGNTSSRGMSVGVVTSTKLHIDPVGSGVTFNEDLVVVGDARVTGILSIGTSSIVLDPNAKTISGVEELQVGETTIKNDSEGNITFVNTFNPTQTINVGIGSTASVNTTGIITASSFTGSLIGTATNATNLNNQAASYYLNYNNFSNTPTALSSFSNDVGFVTSSVVAGYATEGFVNSAVAGIVSSAPATLDTLNELAQALGDDANFSTTVTNLIGTKASLSGATFTGIVTAPSFSGNGSSLTNIDAATLDGLDSTQFLRSDQGDITTGNITISNTQPTLVLEDTDGVDEFAVINAGGTFIIRNQTDARNDFSIGGGGAINSNGILRANAGLNVTGNIVVSGTVDGRDVAADGTKLDGVASNATAYGDSDVDSHLNRTQQVSQNYVLSWDGQDYAWVAQSSGGISNVVEDTTPQLGGNLDLNSKDITGTGNLNVSGVVTATSFSGAIELSSDTSPQLGGNLFTNGNDIFVDDNDLLRLGSGYDFVMTHDGTNTTLKNHTGDLIIGNYGGEYPADDVIIESADDFEVRLNTGMNPGSGTTAIYATGGGSVALNHNGSTKFETTASGIDITGNITVSGTVDGRDLATDGTKLDGIASFATAYGDNDVDSHLNRTQSVSQNYVLSWNGQDYAWVAQSGGGGASEAFKTIAVSGQSDVVADSATDTLTLVAGSNMTITTNASGDSITFASSGGGGGGISNVVEDTTPQLGGNLDLNSKDITGTGNIDITGNLNVSGVSTFKDKVHLLDDDKLHFGGAEGDSGDLQIYHDGNTSQIRDEGTGRLFFASNGEGFGFIKTGGETLANLYTDGAVELYYDNSKKFETTGAGVTITGIATAATFYAQGGTYAAENDTRTDAALIIDENSAILTKDGTYLRNLIEKKSDIINIGQQNTTLIDGIHLKPGTTGGAVKLHAGGTTDNVKFETTGIGVSIANGTSDTATITGPSNLIIDPAVVGDDTGIVRIKGDLFVDGTTTQINSTSLEIADFVVGIASTATTDLLADGAGIQIGPDNTFLYEHNGGTNPSLKSSENLNVATGKAYQIAETERLSADTLSLGTGTTIHSPASNVLTFGTNGTEKVRIKSDGNIGIGTDNPTELLHLAADSQHRILLKRSGAFPSEVSFGNEGNYAVISNNTSGIDLRTGSTPSSSMHIDQNGLVGIGTDNPQHKLNVYNQTASATGGILVQNVTYASNEDRPYLTVGTKDWTGATTNWNTFGFEHRIKSNSEGSPRITVDSLNGELFTIEHGGNIGIGTDIPSSKLHLSGTGTQQIRVDTSGTALSIHDHSEFIGFIGNDAGKLFINAGGTEDTLSLRTAGIEKLRITSGGLVGIGTDNPDTLLHLQSNNPILKITDANQATDNKSWNISAGTAQILRIQAINDSGAGGGKLFDFYRTGTQIEKFLGRSGTDYWFAVDNTNERVGIGTDNPATKLEVAGTGSPTIRVKDLDGTNQFGQIFANNGTFVIESRNDTSDGQIIFRGRDNTGTNEYARFDENGNLGIGTDNPQTKVQINDVYGIETESSSFTASAGVAYTANTYTASDFVNAEYTLFFQHSSGIQSQKVLVMDDGSTAYSQEYGIMSSNGLLVSVGATVKSNNVELLFTPETGVSGIVTYRFTRGTMI